MKLFVSVFMLSFLVVAPAYAYIGPGAAVAFVGYIFGPIAAVAVAVAMVLLWPLRILMKKMKAKKQGEMPAAAPDPEGNE